MNRDIEHGSASEDEKPHDHHKAEVPSAVVPPLYAAESPKSEPSLIAYDAERERKLVRKMDLMIVPTVALLYLMCKSIASVSRIFL